MNPMDEFEQLLASSGISLASLGISDIGLSRNDALKAVGILRRTKHPILGGDVFFRRGNKIEIAYANWFTKRKPSEEFETYLHRSWNTTETYLRNFPEYPEIQVLFSIVVGKAIDMVSTL